MASTHIYDMSNTSAPREGVPIVQPRGRVQLPGMSDQAVELALDPSELDLVDTEAMKARYEQQIREQSHLQKEDHSDMLADHLARQKVCSSSIQVCVNTKCLRIARIRFVTCLFQYFFSE